MNRLLQALIFTLLLQPLLAENQTPDVSTVLPETPLPYTLQIEIAPFNLPSGLQSYASAVYKGKWVLIAGRSNGLHDFSNDINNFPPQFQNTTIFIVDPETGSSTSRDLTSGSGLPQEVIDCLSVTASQSFQDGKMLYIVGGYGINTSTGEMETKSTLTAINLKDLIHWVEGKKSSLVKAVRQTSHPLLQVTGGFLFQNSSHDPFLLMLGQNFVGLYREDSNGTYTQQIRPFWLVDDGDRLAILPHVSATTYPDYRRRDLNIVPILRHNQPAYAVLGGVFTLTGGVWTVPITVFPDGSSFEPDPNAVSTFKQAMNHYDCPAFGLYSTKTQDMYVVLPGGISYGYFENGTFTTDSEIPFINQVTTIQIDRNDTYTQYLMDAVYPVIQSGGNDLLFGAEAVFFPNEGIPLYHNGVIQLDKIKKPTVIGYIAGGIASQVSETSTPLTQTTASPYVFTVTLIPRS
jgi:hypothetical protein